jgi:hypothetical protein
MANRVGVTLPGSRANFTALLAAPRERKVRAFVKETVGDLLINKRAN